MEYKKDFAFIGGLGPVEKELCKYIISVHNTPDLITVVHEV